MDFLKEFMDFDGRGNIDWITGSWNCLPGQSMGQLDFYSAPNVNSKGPRFCRFKVVALKDWVFVSASG